MSHRCNPNTCPRHQTPRSICDNCKARKRAAEKLRLRHMREQSIARQTRIGHGRGPTNIMTIRRLNNA